ncbi:MAG: hypothetical protein KAT35_00625, partial [Candidatus Aenigmarchaeota archaeon]|nr:hypothetical protein [Candidatus Aenigmarchaeota archaeon]
YMDTPECQPDTIWEADHDFYCELSLCDSQTPESLCSPGDEWYNPRCSKSCCSECEGDECCEDSYCYEEYQDACEGLMLVDWNGNMIFDSMIVEDYAQNFCSGMPGCACSDNPVSCSAEPEGIYCVIGACGAECEQDGDCEPGTCSETFEDFCGAETRRLFEYDDDRELDSTLVEDSCENSCEEGCTCTECEPSCEEPEINDYCVLGVCDAECEDSEDCQPFLEDDTCYYDTECQYWCECGWQSDEYCPLPGTVEENICYYGVRECLNEEGCTVDYCELDSYQYCDPMDGCTDLVCVDIEPITLFHDGASEKVFEFPDGGASFTDGKLIVPMDLQVSAAMVDLTGESVSFTTDTIHDFVLVNDVSGSMDDNCHCADSSYSDSGYCSETQGYPYSEDYPCKIEDMKDANVAFSDAVLEIDGNMLGLVSYSTNLKSFI